MLASKLSLILLLEIVDLYGLKSRFCGYFENSLSSSLTSDPREFVLVVVRVCCDVKCM